MQSTSFRTALLAAWLGSAAWGTPVLGQWAVAGEVGSDRFWGGSVENTAEHRSLRPYRPTTFGVGLERRTGSVGMALRLQYASAGLALEGAEAVTAIKGVFTVYSVLPEVVCRLSTVGSGNELLLRGGPLFEVWSVTDEEGESRVGLQGGVSLRVQLGKGLAGSFTAGAAVIPSPFAREQLDESFERRALWRRRVAAGLEYRL
jgi:hypothetical protein